MVSSEPNVTKYSSLPLHVTLFYFIHSTFHIADDLIYLFTYLSVSLTKKGRGLACLFSAVTPRAHMQFLNK